MNTEYIPRDLFKEILPHETAMLQYNICPSCCYDNLNYETRDKLVFIVCPDCEHIYIVDEL